MVNLFDINQLFVWAYDPGKETWQTYPERWLCNSLPGLQYQSALHSLYPERQRAGSARQHHRAQEADPEGWRAVQGRRRVQVSLRHPFRDHQVLHHHRARGWADHRLPSGWWSGRLRCHPQTGSPFLRPGAGNRHGVRDPVRSAWRSLRQDAQAAPADHATDEQRNHGRSGDDPVALQEECRRAPGSLPAQPVGTLLRARFLRQGVPSLHDPGRHRQLSGPHRRDHQPSAWSLPEVRSYQRQG